MYTFTEINERTGFSNGEMFANEEQVQEYFTAENQRAMFGPDAITNEKLLSSYADTVMQHHWHCAF